MANHGGETVAPGQFDGRQRFRQRADLVDFDEDAVGGALIDAPLQTLRARDKQIIAY